MRFQGQGLGPLVSKCRTKEEKLAKGPRSNNQQGSKKTRNTYCPGNQEKRVFLDRERNELCPMSGG